MNRLTKLPQFYRLIVSLVLVGGLDASWELGRRKLRQVSDPTWLFCTDDMNEQKLLDFSWDHSLHLQSKGGPSFFTLLSYPGGRYTLNTSFTWSWGMELNRKIRSFIWLPDLLSVWVAKYQAGLFVLPSESSSKKMSMIKSAVWTWAVENMKVRDLTVCSRTNRNNGGYRLLSGLLWSAAWTVAKSSGSKSTKSHHSSELGLYEEISPLSGKAFVPWYFLFRANPSPPFEKKISTVFSSTLWSSVPFTKIKGSCCLTILLI